MFWTVVFSDPLFLEEANDDNEEEEEERGELGVSHKRAREPPVPYGTFNMYSTDKPTGSRPLHNPVYSSQ